MVMLTARVTEAFASYCGTGRVHSKPGKAINVSFDGPARPHLISFLPDPMAIMPDSISVDEASWRAVRSFPVGSEVEKQGLSFRLDGLRLGGEPQIVSGRPQLGSGGITPDLERNLLGFERACRQHAAGSTQPAGLDDRLRQLGDVLLAETAVAPQLLRGCLGIGRGLTPTSDDMLVGLLSVFSGAALVAAPMVGRGLRTAVDTGKFPLKLAEYSGLTTDVSMSYLHCAAEVRFPTLLTSLVEALFGRSDPDWAPHFALAQRIGGSSGMDMLDGARIGCCCLRRAGYRIRGTARVDEQHQSSCVASSGGGWGLNPRPRDHE